MESEVPSAVFLGGDLCPSGLAPWDGPASGKGNFMGGYLIPELFSLRQRMGERYPEVLAILGNDDMATEEDSMAEGEEAGVWSYMNKRRRTVGGHLVFGYNFVPPTPFLWKDWERYDVSQYVPPGSVSPEEGWRTTEVDDHSIRYGTIKGDLEEMTGEEDLSTAIFLFHTPPAETKLDRVGLDGMMVDHVPLDLNVGSIAVRRFIEARQPLLTLHGHIHESASLTGSWKDKIGRTTLFSAAHDGPELALVRFDLERLEGAQRTLL
jgi:Icc-related predicted phosphoesterase